jgi:hypothetical protein
MPFFMLVSQLAYLLLLVIACDGKRSHHPLRSPLSRPLHNAQTDRVVHRHENRIACGRDIFGGYEAAKTCWAAATPTPRAAV